MHILIVFGLFTVSLFIAAVIVSLDESGTISLPSWLGASLATYMVIGFVVWFAAGVTFVYGP